MKYEMKFEIEFNWEYINMQTRQQQKSAMCGVLRDVLNIYDAAIIFCLYPICRPLVDVTKSVIALSSLLRAYHIRRHLSNYSILTYAHHTHADT